LSDAAPMAPPAKVGSGTAGGAGSGGCDAEAALALGGDVEVHGLESGAGQQLDGQGGTLIGLPAASGRFDVLLWSGKRVSLKAECVRRLGTVPCCRVEDVDASGAAGQFSIGAAVEVHGLESESGRAMNGQRGIVARFHGEAGRFEVRLAQGKLAKLKPGNLTNLGVEACDHVEVCGLQSETGQQLNGQRGTVLGFLEEKGRFEVRFAGAKLVSLRPENLRRLETPSLAPAKLLTLLQDLRETYSNSEDLKAVLDKGMTNGGGQGEEAYTAAMRAAQAPVFERHQYPGGKRGVDLLRADVRRAVLAGDTAVALAYRELSYILRVLPKGEGTGDGGEIDAETRQRVGSKARVLSWRQVGRRVASQGMHALSKELVEEGTLVTEEEVKSALALGQDSLEALVLEKLAAALSCRTLHSVLRELLLRNPWRLGSPSSEWHDSWAEQVCRTQDVEQLVQRGWVAVNGALEPSLVAAASAEFRTLHKASRLRESPGLINRGARFTWLRFAAEEERAHLRLCYPSLFEVSRRLCSLPSALATRDTSGLLARLRVDPTTKIAVHQPGVRHRVHLDSHGGQDNLRMVTCLLYLNEADFSERDGGAIRLYSELASGDASMSPPPVVSAATPHTDLVPLAGRLVLFQSRRLWHEVLPTERDRYVMTPWVPAPV